MKADEINTLASLLKKLGAELEESGSALSAEGAEAGKQDRYIKDRGIVVFPDEWIVIDPEDERLDVSLPMLRNILRNSAEQAGVIYGALNDFELPADAGRGAMRQRSNALRLSATLRDSLRQMHQLLSGDVLPERQEPREFEKPQSAFKKVRSTDQERMEAEGVISPNHPAAGNLTDEEFEESGYDGPMQGISIAEGANSLFSAQIYADLRKLQGNIRNEGTRPDSAGIINALEQIMGKIRERAEIHG